MWCIIRTVLYLGLLVKRLIDNTNLFFREGIRKIPNGGFDNNGRLILTLVIDSLENDIPQAIVKILEHLHFPCQISIDGNGFLEKQSNEKIDIIFCFASPHTGISLPDTLPGKSTMTIASRQQMIKLVDYVNKMDNADIFERWYERHDLVSDYRGSGFKFRRLVNIVITVDPIYTSVSKMFAWNKTKIIYKFIGLLGFAQKANWKTGRGMRDWG